MKDSCIFAFFIKILFTVLLISTIPNHMYASNTSTLFNLSHPHKALFSYNNSTTIAFNLRAENTLDTTYINLKHNGESKNESCNLSKYSNILVKFVLSAPIVSEPYATGSSLPDNTASHVARWTNSNNKLDVFYNDGDVYYNTANPAAFFVLNINTTINNTDLAYGSSFINPNDTVDHVPIANYHDQDTLVAPYSITPYRRNKCTQHTTSNRRSS